MKVNKIIGALYSESDSMSEQKKISVPSTPTSEAGIATSAVEGLLSNLIVSKITSSDCTTIDQI